MSRYPLRLVLPTLLMSVLVGCGPGPHSGDAIVDAVDMPRDTAAAAVRAHARDVEVEGHGIVLRLLPDDRDGSPHQRFLLRLADGGTVLVAHNLDLAPRLNGLATGETVAFRGEYVWNPKGGTLHWTHDDPRGTHPDGWLRWRGRVYR